MLDEVVSCRVSIHAPAWGATTRSRRCPRLEHVSIHAPAWGATGPCRQCAKMEKVSIHAPAWGATWVTMSIFCCSKCFNPRTRVGCDIWMLLVYKHGHKVSIHAPAWGATRRTSRHRSGCRCFNPRTRVGCDQSWGCRWQHFQQSFNPRTRVGCDGWTTSHPPRPRAVSIHAPAWGATLCRTVPPRHLQVSIHAPAWGATARTGRHGWPGQRFQSTHPRGVRRVA